MDKVKSALVEMVRMSLPLGLKCAYIVYCDCDKKPIHLMNIDQVLSNWLGMHSGQECEVIGIEVDSEKILDRNRLIKLAKRKINK